MAAEKGVPKPEKGFFEKNFMKLKFFQHLYYMLSRNVVALTGVVLTGFYFWDAAYFHTADGVPEKYLLVSALIFFANALRKLVLRLIDFRDKTAILRLPEVPHDPAEPWWMRLGFRLALGQRRALIGFIAFTTEAFFAILMLFSWIALGVNEGLFMVSGNFPFIMRPIVLEELTFPENSWMGLSIALGALALSWVNNSIFLMKYPQVRKVFADTFKDLPHVEHLAFYFPSQLFKALRASISVESGSPCEGGQAEEIARKILSVYPDAVISASHKEKLLPTLTEAICKEEDPAVIFTLLREHSQHLKKIEDEQKRASETKPEGPPALPSGGS